MTIKRFPERFSSRKIAMILQRIKHCRHQHLLISLKESEWSPQETEGSQHRKSGDSFREQLNEGERHDQEVKTVPTVLGRGTYNRLSGLSRNDSGKFKQIWKNWNLEDWSGLKDTVEVKIQTVSKAENFKPIYDHHDHHDHDHHAKPTKVTIKEILFLVICFLVFIDIRTKTNLIDCDEKVAEVVL